MPKTSKKDSTPVRNISTTRGNKRPALNSPPEEHSLTSDRVRAIVEDVVKTELSAMMEKLKCSMLDIINKELTPIKKEIRDMNESMTFINSKFELIEADQLNANKLLKNIQEDNKKLESTVADLTQRLNYLEQQSRSNNIEIQCVIERLTQQKSALEHQLMASSTATPLYVATGSAIVQNQQLTTVMKENQKLKKMNAKLIAICHKRGKSHIDANRENEDPAEQINRS
ncbi:unnamed protein product, partial [Brenthis ino]